MPVSPEGHMCAEEGLRSRVSPLQEGKLGAAGSGFHPPHCPCDLGVFRSAAPRLGCFQLSSHPDGLTCLPQVPDSKPASLLPPAPSSTFQPFSGAGGPAGGMVWMTPLGRPPWQDSAPGLGSLELGEEPPTPTGPVLP